MKTLGNLLNALLNVLAFVYLGGTLVLLVLRLVVGESVGIVVLFNSLLPVLLIPAFVFFIIGLLFRRWLVVAFSLPVFGAFIFWYGAYFLPRGLNPNEGEMVVSVMTYNALLGEQSADDISQLMRFKDTDFVALQELYDQEQLVELTASVAETYPYFVAIGSSGLYSKYPLNSGTMEEIWRSTPEGRILRVVADVDGQPVTVIVFHPVPPAGNPLPTNVDRRNTGYAQLLSVLDEEPADQPVIIAGDLNASDRSDDYWRVRDAGFRDVYQDTAWGLGFTFPQFSELSSGLPGGNLPGWFPPLLRLDYVMHSGLRSLRSEVVYTGGSDHFPVVASLGLQHTPIASQPEEREIELTERGRPTPAAEATAEVEVTAETEMTVEAEATAEVEMTAEVEATAEVEMTAEVEATAETEAETD